MRGVSCIESVTLHTGNGNSSKNDVVTLYVIESPAVQHMRQGAIEVVQYITCLLDADFEITQKTVRTSGEQNGAWIVVASEHEDTLYKVRVVSRSWTQNQIDAFQEIIRLLGWLHSWKIDEEKH